MSFKALSPQPLSDVKGKVVIAAVDLPHISNFTDFDAFEGEPDVAFSIARSAEQLQDADVIIIPGSKNVIGDLNYLAKRGLDKGIVSRAHRGETTVVGICGGYQMLGQVVKDPSGVESSPGSEQPALDLLPMTTVLEEQKTLVLTQATHIASGCTLKGYEIHHGKTVTESLKPAVVRDDGEVIGYGDPETRVWGTYLHGLFDDDLFRRWTIDQARKRKGLAPLGKVMAKHDIEPALDRLADTVRRRLDMEAIYRLLKK